MYAPTVENRSGEILAQGISGASNSIADLIDTLGQRHKQLKAMQTMATDGLGMDKDQVSKMSLEQLQGTLQGAALKSANAQRQAEIQFMNARTNYMGQNAEEANAMGAIAPAVQDWMAKNPGRTPSAGDVIGMMSGARMNPRTQGVVLGKLLPQMMAGEGGAMTMPQAWKSPTGNPYVIMGKEILPDRAAQNPDDATSPEGYTAVPDGKGGVKYLRAPAQKTLPPVAQTQLTSLLNDYTSAQNVLNSSDDELKQNAAGLTPAQLRASAKTRLQRTQQNAKNLLDFQKQLGTVTDDQHSTFMSSFGLGAGSNGATDNTGSSGGATGGASAAAGPGGRVPVWDKTGKQFTVPEAQKDAAVQQGYSLTPPGQ